MCVWPLKKSMALKRNIIIKKVWHNGSFAKPFATIYYHFDCQLIRIECARNNNYARTILTHSGAKAVTLAFFNKPDFVSRFNTVIISVS